MEKHLPGKHNQQKHSGSTHILHPLALTIAGVITKLSGRVKTPETDKLFEEGFSSKNPTRKQRLVTSVIGSLNDFDRNSIINFETYASSGRLAELYRNLRVIGTPSAKKLITYLKTVETLRKSGQDDRHDKMHRQFDFDNNKQIRRDLEEYVKSH